MARDQDAAVVPSLRVNGESYAVDCPPDMPLLWVLRDILGLTGTKYGCGIGVCGACTVLLDEDPVTSCTTSAASARQHEVKTIEDAALNEVAALQAAWAQYDVAQCGYCQPGQIMRAAALLLRLETPDEHRIREWMNANLCRCGSYLRIISAVAQVVNER